MTEDGLAPEPEEAAELPLEDRLEQAALAAMMGDPYEVGLRIALDDGVAAALPTVARELAVLDRAIGVVRHGLAGLAPAAVMSAVRVPPVPEVGAPGAEAAPEVTRPGASPAPDESARRGAAPELRHEPLMSGVLRAAERAAAEIVPSASPPPPEPPAPAPMPVPMRLAWQQMDWPSLADVPGVGAMQALPAPLTGRAASALAAPGLAAPGVAAPLAGAPWTPLADLPAAAPDTATADTTWPAVRPSAAPPAESPAIALPPEFAEPATPPRSEAPPQDDSEGEARVLEGRLEIDGALLGRFVAEHLAREAGRPPSGMTGFDPLLSPQWAGALQG